MDPLFLETARSRNCSDIEGIIGQLGAVDWGINLGSMAARIKDLIGHKELSDLTGVAHKISLASIRLDAMEGPTGAANLSVAAIGSQGTEVVVNAVA